MPRDPLESWEMCDHWHSERVIVVTWIGTNGNAVRCDDNYAVGDNVRTEGSSCRPYYCRRQRSMSVSRRGLASPCQQGRFFGALEQCNKRISFRCNSGVDPSNLLDLTLEDE